MRTLTPGRAPAKAAWVVASVFASALASAQELAGAYPLSPAASLTEADLKMVAGFLGISYQTFEVEIDHPFCVRLSIEASATPSEVTPPAGPRDGGLCSVAGPQRITVAFRTTEGDSLVGIRVATQHVPTGVGATFSFQPIAVPPGGWSLFDTHGPEGSLPILTDGEQTVIADYAFGPPSGRLRMRVVMELLGNPTGILGTMPMNVSLGER
jgi:hypothetical protein